VETPTTVFRLTEAEFLDAQRLNFARGKGRTTDLLLRASAVLPLAVAVVAGVLGQLVLALVMVVLAGLLAAYRWMLVPRSWRKLYREDSRWAHEIQIAPSEGGIRLDSPITHADVSWDAFERYVESDRMVLLYQAEGGVNILPKRAFEADELGRFLDLVHRKLAGSNPRRDRPAGTHTIRT
jgi:hypothetical protein